MRYYQQIGSRMRIEWSSLQKKVIHNMGEVAGLRRPVSKSQSLFTKNC